MEIVKANIEFDPETRVFRIKEEGSSVVTTLFLSIKEGRALEDLIKMSRLMKAAKEQKS